MLVLLFGTPGLGCGHAFVRMLTWACFGWEELTLDGASVVVRTRRKRDGTRMVDSASVKDLRWEPQGECQVAYPPVPGARGDIAFTVEDATVRFGIDLPEVEATRVLAAIAARLAALGGLAGQAEPTATASRAPLAFLDAGVGAAAAPEPPRKARVVRSTRRWTLTSEGSRIEVTIRPDRLRARTVLERVAIDPDSIGLRMRYVRRDACLALEAARVRDLRWAPVHSQALDWHGVPRAGERGEIVFTLLGRAMPVRFGVNLPTRDAAQILGEIVARFPELARSTNSTWAQVVGEIPARFPEPAPRDASASPPSGPQP